MSHIFISYSHKDKEYVEKLEQKLIEEGFNVWIDHRIDYGSQWTEAIENAIDTCDAYIVVMSADAKKSPWVRREVIHAERRKKPFFPVLLDGEFWFSLGDIQFVDVTNGSLPPEKFYKRLEKVTARKKIEKTVQPASATKLKPKLSKLSIKPKIVLGIFGVLILGFITIFGIPKMIGFIGQTQTPTSSPTAETTNTHVIYPTSITEVITETPIITQIPLPTQTSTPLPNQITDAEGAFMVLVPGGEFTMGSENDEDDEKPIHIVDLDTFYIDQYEVTNAQYKLCVDEGVCETQLETHSNTRPNYYGNSEFDNYPVIWVDWNKANVFCEWRKARLPTEAEWEKAARGTEGRIYPWGDEITEYFANYNSSGGDTTPVGSYKSGKSVYDAYDMAGNVWEWVADWYDSEYYDILPEGVKNPLGPLVRLQDKVLRGGSFKFNGSNLRTSKRYPQSPNMHNNDFGFRCARSVTP